MPTTVATDLHPHGSLKLSALVILEEQVWEKKQIQSFYLLPPMLICKSGEVL